MAGHHLKFKILIPSALVVILKISYISIKLDTFLFLRRKETDAKTASALVKLYSFVKNVKIVSQRTMENRYSVGLLWKNFKKRLSLVFSATKSHINIYVFTWNCIFTSKQLCVFYLL